MSPSEALADDGEVSVNDATDVGLYSQACSLSGDEVDE